MVRAHPTVPTLITLNSHSKFVATIALWRVVHLCLRIPTLSPSFCDQVRNGMRKVNRVSSLSDFTVNVPSCALAISDAICRPRPRP